MIDRLLSEARQRQSGALGLAIVMAVVAAVTGVALLATSGWLLAGAAMAGAGGIAAIGAFNYLLPSAAIRAFAIARTLGRYAERLYSHRAALFALASVRPALFACLAASDPAAAFARPSGEVAAQLGSDVDALEDAVVRRVTLPAGLAAAAAGLVASACAGYLAALGLLVGLAAMRLSARALAPRLIARNAKRRADAMARIKATYVDYAGCSAEIAVYGLAPQIVDVMANDLCELDAADLALVRCEALVHGTQVVLAAVTVAGVLASAQGTAALAAGAALGAAAAVEAWSGNVRSELQRPRVQNALQRLDALALLPARTAPTADLEILRQSPISFAVAETEWEIPSGGRVLITGSSGAGKSRLLGTLMGLRHDAPERIRVGGQDVRQLGLETLREIFAGSPQDSALISGTVADNLRLSRHGVTEEQMWAALGTACLGDKVRALPDGLDQWLGGDGTRLSGGERKRLSLARALLAQRPWLVLDEPSEGLDSATEQQLSDNLAAWLEQTGTGLVMVSHRQIPRALAATSICL